MVTILNSHKQNTMVSTLNVLLLTLNKALPGGRPRITRSVLMLISLRIMLNHASCSLYLSSYALVWMCVMKHIHRHSKSSMVLGLKCLLRSNWHGVKFDWCSRVNTFIDIGCTCGLTHAGKTSNPIGWVIELNSNGKVRQGFGLMLHNILMLMQSWSSLAWVSILVRLNFSFK